MISIPRSVTQMLGQHIGRYPSSDGFVFSAPQGGPIRHRNFYSRYFRPAVEAAHTAAFAEDRKDEAIRERLRFHDLRHTFAAILIANGRHMEEERPPWPRFDPGYL